MTILWMTGEIKLTLGVMLGRKEKRKNKRGRGEVDNTRLWLPSMGKRGISGDNYAVQGNRTERVDATAISPGTVGVAWPTNFHGNNSRRTSYQVLVLRMRLRGLLLIKNIGDRICLWEAIFLRQAGSGEGDGQGESNLTIPLWDRSRPTCPGLCEHWPPWKDHSKAI